MPVSLPQTACAGLITTFLRETFGQPAQFLSAAFVEYVARSRIVELTINSLLLIVGAATNTVVRPVLYVNLMFPLAIDAFPNMVWCTA